MSMQTNEFGDKGYYVSKSNGKRCIPQKDGSYDMNQCYFDRVIRSQAAVGDYGAPIHTLKQEQGTDTQGLPDKLHPMWTHYDLQNKCDTNNLDTCNDNANCKLNDLLIVPTPVNGQGKIKDKLLGMRDRSTTPRQNFWKDKWTKDTDESVCGWKGINCSDEVYNLKSGGNEKYITKINIDPYYLDENYKEELKICNYDDQGLSQNDWLSKQNQECNTYEIDRACTDNQFCKWTDDKKRCYKIDDDGKETPININKVECEKLDNHEWKVGQQPINSKYSHYKHFYSSDKVNIGTCSLDSKFNKRSGLNKEDEFKDKTMSDVMGEINNGRVATINIFDDVKVTSRGDVVMKQDNQETAVKGLLEETALSNIFFSEQNIKVLQDTIRYDVYKRTNFVIDKQSEDALYIVMRSIMLQHGNFKVLSNDLLNEIHYLNKLVVKYCGKEVGSNVLQYQGYIKDLEKLPVPIDRPGYTSRAWNKPYDLSARNDLHSEHTYTMGGITHTYQD